MNNRLLPPLGLFIVPGLVFAQGIGPPDLGIVSDIIRFIVYGVFIVIPLLVAIFSFRMSEKLFFPSVEKRTKYWMGALFIPCNIVLVFCIIYWLWSGGDAIPIESGVARIALICIVQIAVLLWTVLFTSKIKNTIVKTTIRFAALGYLAGSSLMVGVDYDPIVTFWWMLFCQSGISDCVNGVDWSRSRYFSIYGVLLGGLIGLIGSSVVHGVVRVRKKHEFRQVGDGPT